MTPERELREAESRGMLAAAKLLCVRCRRNEPITINENETTAYHGKSNAPCLAWKIRREHRLNETLLAAAPAPTPSWLPSAKRLEGQFNELLEAMYEELKPGPTGGNDYYDAWQVFGEQLTIAHEVISALKELPAPTPAPPTQLLCDRITNYLSNGGLFNSELMEHEKVRGLLIQCRDALRPAEPVVPEREPHPGWSLAKEIAADLEDAGLVESGLVGIKAMEVIEQRLAAAPRAAGGQREAKLNTQQVEKAIAQSTMAGRFSAGYCADRLNEILREEQ